MSRRTGAVKIKHNRSRRSTSSTLETVGPLDIHFHGALGIDLMTAPSVKLNELSDALWKRGVAGFCPTTLSAPAPVLAETVERLGRWIRSNQFPGAKPLGIHLEGPFINSMACGAHPPHAVRKLNWEELDQLWALSQGTLKILTLAPEGLTPSQLSQLSKWTASKRILLSLGHSQATEKEAQLAFDSGFQGVTHAWNALPFHQRQTGALGAAMGRPDVYLELIIDQVHVSPTVIRWTLDLHPSQLICFISDCISAGGYCPQGAQWQTFGPLKVRFKDGACRLPDDRLAGGGYLLTESYCRWVKEEATRRAHPLKKTLESTIHHITKTPLRILGLPARALADRKVIWQFKGSDKIDVFPVDSHRTRR